MSNERKYFVVSSMGDDDVDIAAIGPFETARAAQRYIDVDIANMIEDSNCDDEDDFSYEVKRGDEIDFMFVPRISTQEYIS